MSDSLSARRPRFSEDSHVRIALLACAILSPVVLAACNTTKGVGKDVEAAGEGIQEVADDAKDAIKD